MTIKSNIEWKAWGIEDPYFGILTAHDRVKNGPNPWNKEDFYSNGEFVWNKCVTEWKKYGVTFDSCLEIGCGAGRITHQLAKYFTKVHAVDVSEGMISLAKENIDATNITFHMLENTILPLPDNSVSAAYSIHVFQHFDEISYGYSYLKEISRVLMPGGTFMIHIPIYIWPYGGSFRRPYMLMKFIERMKNKRKRYLISKGKKVDLMVMNSYPVDYFFSKLPSLGFEDIKILLMSFEVSVPIPFIFAKKMPLI